MLSCSRYLIRGMPANLILYYLITISTFIINILIIFTVLISLSLYPFNNSFTSDLSDKRTEIDPFPEYNIFIVFTVQGILSMRLISIFNSNIRSVFGILFNLPYLVNMNLFEIFVFFTFFLSTVLPFFYTVFYWFWSYSGIYVIIIYVQLISTLNTFFILFIIFFFIFMYWCRDRSNKCDQDNIITWIQVRFRFYYWDLDFALKGLNLFRLYLNCVQELFIPSLQGRNLILCLYIVFSYYSYSILYEC